jgi:hypothetical protein
MGWSRKVIAKVRYAWSANPNYNVHILGGSLAFAW